MANELDSPLKQDSRTMMMTDTQLANEARSTICDMIATNTRLMYVLLSPVVAAGACLDLSRTLGTNERT